MGGIIHNTFKAIVSLNTENNLNHSGMPINVILNKNKLLKGLRIQEVNLTKLLKAVPFSAAMLRGGAHSAITP